ncbi:hypothetical protein Pcinc_023141 [Petrolisthes cinctipes]|uniref:Uncharacterized protein n=1 Tax=Petrolisthes cinctipes TaxID=88211 RepID=A0AAE1FCK8_PETCI|nr:hypothetical protein Pcinc_023141 [Petrolisthes cinctipes]
MGEDGTGKGCEERGWEGRGWKGRGWEVKGYEDNSERDPATKTPSDGTREKELHGGVREYGNKLDKDATIKTEETRTAWGRNWRG